MKIKYYDVALSRVSRTDSDLHNDEKTYCFKVHGSFVHHVIGAIAMLDNQSLWTSSLETYELVRQRVGKCLESIHECTQNYGATFQLDEALVRSLEALQGENLPPPPWEFRINTDGYLEFRTKEEI